MIGNWPTKKHPGPERRVTCPLRKPCDICGTNFGRKITTQGYLESVARWEETPTCCDKCRKVHTENKKKDRIENTKRGEAALAEFNLGARAT